MLSGWFYLSSAALFLTAAPMALLARNGYSPLGPVLFGAVTAATFFIPGWQYHRQRLRALRAGREA
jgi:hypothetical protein